ncbi:MAG TPA: SPOR domain-containing protein, partial [Zoogloea sp.]|nr:SPOR domain-containing protein [Zoogloea sp.]
MADNDSQIDLKKRARRRLVGSAALALAAAIVLPMVMDHEPRPASQDVQIRIPSQEGSNFTSRVITGKAPAPSQPVAGVAAGENTAPVLDDKEVRLADPEAAAPVFKPGEELIPPPRKTDPPKAEVVKPEPRTEPKKPDT